MKKDNVLIGLFLVIIGVIIFGNQNNFWDINIFFKGWWTLFIIIPSIFAIIKQDYLTGTIGLVIGSLLLLSVNDYIEFRSIWPVFIILIGLVLIFKTTGKVKSLANENYTGVFSGSDAVISGEFKGTSATAIFGGVDLNLKNAEIQENVVIDCLCLFGGIDIIVPDNVMVKVKGYPVFGGIENKVNKTEGKVVFINASCIFGGITIK